MKKKILKWLGLDEKIQAYETNIRLLDITVQNLKNDVNDAYEKYELMFRIMNDLGAYAKEGEKWWEKSSITTRDIDTFQLAERIKDSAKRKWMAKYPSIKEQVVFHGHCLSCVVPIEEGVGKCSNCSICDPGNPKDLFRKKNESNNSR